jgi:hypothetical protein
MQKSAHSQHGVLAFTMPVFTMMARYIACRETGQFMLCDDSAGAGAWSGRTAGIGLKDCPICLRRLDCPYHLEDGRRGHSMMRKTAVKQKRRPEAPLTTK